MQLVRGGSSVSVSGALDQITRCYSQRLLEAGRRHCRTGAEAEDAVQDALIAATQHLNELRDDSKLEGWLVRVVASACRRLGRGLKNDASLHERVSFSEPEPEPAASVASGSDPEAEAARRELGQLLEHELLALSASDRSILLLAELEDVSAAEIGAELRMSEGAVRTRLSRSRKRLLIALQKKTAQAL